MSNASKAWLDHGSTPWRWRDSSHVPDGEVAPVSTLFKLRPIVCLVEDDDDVRDALTLMLEANGYPVKTFSKGQSFLDQAPHLRDVVVLMDVRLPDVSGLELLAHLRAQMPTSPVIVMTGFGRVPLAVRAMKLGALDFLEKPIVECVLLRLLQTHHVVSSGGVSIEASVVLARLTIREMETLSKLAGGLTSKQIGRSLGISPRTVDVHRASILQKLGATSTVAALGMMRKLAADQYQLLMDDPAQLFSLCQSRAAR